MCEMVEVNVDTKERVARAEILSAHWRGWMWRRCKLP